MPTFPTIRTAYITQVFNNYAPGSYGGDGRHKGIDYGISVGSPIYSCLPGVVELAQKQQTGYGRHVRVRHTDGSLGIYGHLNEIMVEVGAKLTDGQQIGKSGGDPRDNVDGDGFSTGAHLHWEIRPKGVNTDQGAVDPFLYCLKYLPMKYETAEVTAPVGLNVRTEPSASAPAMYTLKKREVVRVVEQSNGWARLQSLRPEWCSMTYLLLSGIIVNPDIVVIPDPDDPKPKPVVEFTDKEKLDRLWKAHPELQI
jgi:murein DD-endopeptidase MepM/ murein hydrolase activator NlpD